MDAVLASHGLSRDQFESVSVPQSAMGETLAGGEIAFGVSGEPWITRITEAGQGVLIDQFEVAEPGFQYSFVSFGPSILQDNPEVGRRFMVAYLRSLRTYAEGKTDRNVEIIAAATELDPELVQQMCWPTFSENAVMNTDDVQAFQEWAVSKGYLDAVLPANEVFDNSFQQYAVEQLAP
jgi:NitT/TauT family transport system substrate-binding protein